MISNVQSHWEGIRCLALAAIRAIDEDDESGDSAPFVDVLDIANAELSATDAPIPDASIAMPTIEGPAPARRENSVFDEPWPGTKANLLGELK